MYGLKSARLGILAVCLLASSAHSADVDKILPDDTEIVVTVNVRQLLGSALVKKHGLEPVRKFLKSNDLIQKRLESVGFDPLRDVAEITVAIPGANKPPKGFLLVCGKFDKDKLAAKAEAVAKQDKRLKMTFVSGYPVYVLTPPADADSREGHVAVLNGEMILVTVDAAGMIEALEKYTGKRKPAAHKELTQLLGRPERDATIWIGALGAGLKKNPLASDDKVKEVLNRIDFLTLGLAVTEGVRVKGVVAATGADAAQALHKDFEGGLESMKGVVALVRDNRPELAPLADFLDTLKVRAAGNTLVLEGSASGDVIDKALKPTK